MNSTKSNGIEIPEAQTRKIAAAQSAIRDLMIQMDSYPDREWAEASGVEINFTITFKKCVAKPAKKKATTSDLTMG